MTQQIGKSINIVCIFNGNAPIGAELAILNPSGEFVQGFYCFKTEKYNDGTQEDVLYHKSSLPVWQPSSIENIPDFLRNNAFLEVIH